MIIVVPEVGKVVQHMGELELGKRPRKHRIRQNSTSQEEWRFWIRYASVVTSKIEVLLTCGGEGGQHAGGGGSGQGGPTQGGGGACNMT